MISVVGTNISSALRVAPSTSSRILDIPCKVCGDNSSGKHYNIFACDGCAGFFKRSIRKNRQYVCKAKSSGTCVVDKTHRNQCRACRLLKCQEAGMNKDAVQHERGPRNSTLRRQQQQMVQLLNETAPKLMNAPPNAAIDLVLPTSSAPPRFHPPLPLSPSGTFFNQPPIPIPRIPFGFHAPPPVVLTETLNPSHICEAAARLLFFNVTWAKTVSTFTSLTIEDQLLLLEESWRELFILGAAQYLPPLELGPLVHCSSLVKREPERLAALEKDVLDFQSVLTRIIQFRVDPYEFACLRAILLFKTTFDNMSPNSKLLKDAEKVVGVQENTQLMLNKYVLATYPSQPLRFGKLLLLLPVLQTVKSSTIEELFFKNTIGNIPIVNIICNMYRTTLND
ncbi:nuclear receptor subfamily 2 group E member 1 [Photinus pyralis]|uniref:nuclear receptor subfamily 2 group E member 1 n=1 Tax=Photinus pyralis TaxID=7054 RepID=UPI001266E686|nr:nuclear receptor subfamily 2 group E member 1 [Photinus pyralis]